MIGCGKQKAQYSSRLGPAGSVCGDSLPQRKFRRSIRESSGIRGRLRSAGSSAADQERQARPLQHGEHHLYGLGKTTHQ
ncbi:hypothetical protein CJF30_00011143 [Rutstroemia sp. NJR-2017a BBW]|nr:hypothetical protein CJF30_00011143 [Rutstroemia sp. NJR-2017a BBW]